MNILHTLTRRLNPIAWVLLPLAAPTAAAAGHVPPWSELTLAAAKTIGKVEMHLTLRHLSRELIAARLIDSPEGRAAEPRENGAFYLKGSAALEALLVGRAVSHSELWINPDGAVLQRIKLREGRKTYTKSYRFTDRGAYRVKVSPEGKQQAERPRSKWTKIKKSFYPYDPKTLGCETISEPTALFYLLSAQSPEALDKTCFFFDDTLNRLDIRALDRERISVDYRLGSATGSKRVRTKVDATVVAVDKPSGNGKQADELEFLGLRGEIRFHIDPKTHLLLRIGGKAPTLGKVALNLARAVGKP